MSERRMALSIAARLDRLEEERAPAGDRTSAPAPPMRAPSVTDPGVETRRERPQRPSAAPVTPPIRKPAVGLERPITCAVCGALNEHDETFCGTCGSFLEWAGRKPVDAQGPSGDAAVVVPAATPRVVRPEPADETGPPPPPPEAPAQLSLEDLADYITAYIPTWVVSLFLPLWGALVAAEAGGAEFGQPIKLAIAIATALTAGMWVWGEGYRKARTAAARGRRRRRVRPFDALRVGAWEVGAATVAAFAWATAAPSSWASFSSAFWPLATVIGATVILGVAGNFVAPLEGDR